MNLHLHIRAVLPLTALAAAAGGGTAHAAETTIAEETRPFVASSWGDTVAWSRWDADLGAYRLVVRRDGETRALAVAPSPVPFDVDLGTNRAGSVHAVYTRCQTDADGVARAGTCDVYRTSVATGREQRLRSLSSPAADERQPTIHAGRIAFIRREGRPGRRARDVLRIGGPAADGARTRALVSVPLHRGGALLHPELSARRVAYVLAGRRNGFPRQTIRLLTLRTGADRVVHRAGSGGANAAGVTRPAFSPSGRSLFWARTNTGSGTGNRFVRHAVRSGRLSYAIGHRDVVSAGFAGGATGFYAVRSGVGRQPARLVATGRLSFTADPGWG